MSGAHSAYKGDVAIEFINNPGKYIIECKLTAALDKTNVPDMKVTLSWLSKLKREAKAMNAKFSVFVFHYHNTRIEQNYVWIHEDDVRKIIQYSPEYKDTLLQLLDTTLIKDIRYKKYGEGFIKTYHLHKDRTDRAMLTVNDIKGTRLLTQEGIYLVLYLQDFRNIVYNI